MKDIVKIEVLNNGIAHLRMQDEEHKNTFSDDFVDAVIAGLDKLENEHNPKVCILSGLPDVFSGGADKQNLMDLCDGKIHVKDLLISERIVNTPFPIIAAMEGHAVGGGLIMAVCSDMVVAARESRYGVVFMNMGFTPGIGCTELLANLVGPFIANEMMYTGKCYKGKELAEKGIQINYIVPKAEVPAKAENIALQISEKSVKSISLLKHALSAKKKQQLITARVQEDFMHRLSFGFPETRKTIEEHYGK
ncbi:enoyl-CoA hydratase/isomerase family protein [bacterium]|nr:enoyl-CoA hydratase/isomerase family protein [bacterium]